MLKDVEAIKRDLEKLPPETAWAFYRLLMVNLMPASSEQEAHLPALPRPSGSAQQ